MYNEFYTAILSSYMQSMVGHYTVTFESDVPLKCIEIKPEGYDLKAVEIEVRYSYDSLGYLATRQ